MRSLTMSFAAAAVLRAVDNGYQYGFDIIGATGLPGGTVYPILRRLEDAAHVTSRWEDHAVAQREQRPPRKYYEITKAGAQALAAALDRYAVLRPEPRKSPATRKPRTV